ncbi:MAG TPA: type II toxin-antitoxin system VapC family toxin [Thermoanaerobaculia bacterium]|nr:type II toxin-antitoxin system VapC family toxin [Thermoanaerobaculia bacterium]
MTKLVVDASVAAKWVFPEEHSEAAGRLLTGNRELWAPDLIWAETGNIAWKKHRRGEVSEEAARTILLDFRRFPLQTHPSEKLLAAAWELATGLDRSFYDSLYLALALHQGCFMVTADRRLYNALTNVPVRLPVVWVGDVS